MAETFFLHIGTGKSGTTTIQRVMKQQRHALAQSGVGQPFRALGRRGKVADEILALPSLRPEQADAQVSRLRELILAEPSPVGLFSAEALTVMREEGISPLIEGLTGVETHVVITARDIARQVPSTWQQGTKVGRWGSYADFCRALPEPSTPESEHFSRRFNVADMAEAWARHLDPARIHVIALPQSSGDSTWLLRAFFGLMGVDAQTIPLAVKSTNTSMSHLEAEVLRQLIPKIRAHGSFTRADLYGVISHRWRTNDASGPRMAIPDDLVSWCVEGSRDQVRRLQAGHYDLVGDVEDLLVSPDCPTYDPEISLEAQLDFATDRLAELLTQGLGEQAESGEGAETPGRAGIRGTAGRVARKLSRG